MFTNPISSLTGWASGFNWIKIAVYAVIIAGLLGMGAYGGYRWELGKYETLVAQDAKAYAKGVKLAAADQKKRDDITLAAAVKDARAQPIIVDHYHTITKEIPAHVSDNAHCITYGLVRLLNDAAGPEAYPVPDAASEPDDTCAPVTWREFASDLTADYQAKAQNDQQLTDLQGWARDQEAANTSSGK